MLDDALTQFLHASGGDDPALAAPALERTLPRIQIDISTHQGVLGTGRVEGEGGVAEDGDGAVLVRDAGGVARAATSLAAAPLTNGTFPITIAGGSSATAAATAAADELRVWDLLSSASRPGTVRCLSRTIQRYLTTQMPPAMAAVTFGCGKRALLAEKEPC